MTDLRNKWYGVKLSSGKVRIKRYTGESDLDDERSSPAVIEATDAIVALTYEEAKVLITKKLGTAI